MRAMQGMRGGAGSLPAGTGLPPDPQQLLTFMTSLHAAAGVPGLHPAFPWQLPGQQTGNKTTILRIWNWFD